MEMMKVAEDARATWTEPEWRSRMERHTRRLSPILSAHLDRASRQEPHPVIDFLFKYYSFSPAHLLRWSPGVGVVLAGEIPDSLQAIREGSVTPAGWWMDPGHFPEARRDPLAWVVSLLRAVADRPPRFGCFGLHEWAMVYRSDSVRHPQLPLRYTVEETANIVDALPIACSHYDAFRFFTPAARPRNRLQPDLASRIDLEQCGCLHVNMDLYKWSSMFYPWISSDLIADCFLLALRIREVDMRASPYDLTGLGLDPIPIETEEGRCQYVEWQKTFSAEAVPLRQRLIEALAELIRLTGRA